jgi:type III pantothenate kinase
MLLAVDIGNTNIKFGVFDGEKLTFKLSLPTVREISADGLAKVAGSKLTQTVSSAIISSVVPEIDVAMREFITAQYRVAPVFVANDFDFGLRINYQPLSDAGADRLVNTYSAVEKYGPPCIVCSFGTALAIDVVDADRTLVGGLIAPGMNTLATALRITTAKLPEVEIKLPVSVVQNSTVGSIQSGIVYGYFGLVENLITKVKNEIGDNPKVIATGGFASLVAENTDQIDIVDENLMLDGLRRLHDRLQA